MNESHLPQEHECAIHGKYVSSWDMCPDCMLTSAAAAAAAAAARIPNASEERETALRAHTALY